MDVFQVLTLCSLLGVMFVGVFGYGTYRNWRRNQLELIRAPSVDFDVSNINDSTERIYPNIRVSSKPKTKKSELQTGIFAGTRPGTRATGETNSDPKQASNARATSVATPVDASHSSTERELDLFDGACRVENSVTQSIESSQHKEDSSSQQEADKENRDGSSTQVEDDRPNVLAKHSPQSEQPDEKQKSKVKFRRVKNSSRLERKPPQPSKRRKSKSEPISNGATKPSTRNGDVRAQRNGEDFVMFFVMGEHDSSFRMNDIGHFLQARDLVLDEMGLFCRNDRENGEVLFKVGDVFYPGSFRVEDLEHYRTGGISLAMKIPNVNNAQVVFEQMLTLANECAERFFGTVKDENFNNMSNQTLAHYRSRVSDFRRKQLTMYA